MPNQPWQVDQCLDQSRCLMEKVFGFREFRPGQEEILEAVFSGEDILAVMPTGGGKSLCYQLPALVMPGATLVISPLIALMKDQVDSLRTLDLPVASINSFMNLKEQEKVLEKIAAGSYKLIYASPERLRNSRFMNALKKWPLSLVAVDEAHCISEWGHDFRPDYLRIREALESLGRPQTLALTATATDRIREDIFRNLNLRAPRQFITGFDRKNLFFEAVSVNGPREKISLLTDRLRSLPGGAIIYTGTRKNVDTLVRHLNREEIQAAGYHAGMEEEERNRVQEVFLEGASDIIVATNAFGMGIDRSDIRLVIHHQLPGSVEAYYQECGRAGRDGEPARCLLLFSPADRSLQEFFIEASYPDRDTVLAVYRNLLPIPDDPIWLTHREIGSRGEPRVTEMAVASSLKILEEAGALRRINRYENRAEFYLHLPPRDILQFTAGKPSAKKSFMAALCESYTDEELLDGIQFLPEEMMERARLSKEAFRRVIAAIEEKREGTYIPPFRGRGLRLLSRPAPEDLQIDFPKLQLRKAHELEKLNQMMAYGASTRCRRAFLLGYFGEGSGAGNCGGCDVCRQKPRQPASGKENGDPWLALKILSGVARLRGRFGQSMAVKMLAGSKESKIEQFGLSRLSTYGLLAGVSQAQIEKWIRELSQMGLVKQALAFLGGKNYPVLLLTPRGREALKKRERIFLSLSPPKARAADEKESEDFREDVFEELRKLRSRLSRRENLPPYCIFHDRTLKEMARNLPQTPQKMMAIVGVGEITFRKYGQDFLDIIVSCTSAQGGTSPEVPR